jgi:hypothetical protein
MSVAASTARLAGGGAYGDCACYKVRRKRDTPKEHNPVLAADETPASRRSVAASTLRQSVPLVKLYILKCALA